MKANRGGSFLAQHGRAIFVIGGISGLGILASAGFQIVSIRGLGPQAFGLLASFLALINIASIGSGALRNSVAVATASGASRETSAVASKRRMDSSLIEALALGAICTVGVLVVPWLGVGTGRESSDVIALLFVAGTITPYFLFARAQGILQGAGDPRSVIWWSTGAQIAQLLLSIAVLLCGFGALGILSVLLVTAVIGAAGSSIQARRSSVRLSGRPFTVESSVVLLLTITFAWLTNMDVVLVRAGSPENIAGAYAAAAVLIKTTLIVPATLSLYLLPRFVSRKKDASMTKYGVNVTLAITFLSGVAMFIIVSLAGGLIVPVFGPGYQSSLQLLPWLALAWLPWAMAQGLLIRLTASSSKLALVALVVVAIVQWIGSTALLPDVLAMIALNGILGFAALVVLFLVHLRSSKIDGRGVES